MIISDITVPCSRFLHSLNSWKLGVFYDRFRASGGSYGGKCDMLKRYFDKYITRSGTRIDLYDYNSKIGYQKIKLL